MGIKISAPGLENALAGSELLVAKNETEIQAAKAEIQSNLYDILDKYVDKSVDGVCVQASTLGSMEALLEFLLSSKIPVCSISIGPVHKKDVLKAMKVLAVDESKIKKEFATILAKFALDILKAKVTSFQKQRTLGWMETNEAAIPRSARVKFDLTLKYKAVELSEEFITLKDLAANLVTVFQRDLKYKIVEATKLDIKF